MSSAGSKVGGGGGDGEEEGLIRGWRGFSKQKQKKRTRWTLSATARRRKGGGFIDKSGYNQQVTA